MAIPGGENGRKLFGLEMAFMLLFWLFFGLRLWCRRLRGQRFQRNDYLLGLGCLSQLGFSVIGFLMILYGGQSMEPGEVSKEQTDYSHHLSLAGSILWIIPLFFIKTSILDFYTTIFKTNAYFRQACHIVMLLLLLYTTISTTTVCFTCIPIKKLWEPSVPGACINVRERVLLLGIINLAFDVIIVVLPMPIIWTLNMSRPKQITVSMILGAGLGVCVITAVRLYYLVSPSHGVKVAYYTLTVLEGDLGIVVACLPLLRPFAMRILPQVQWLRVQSPKTSNGSGRDKDGSGLSDTLNDRRPSVQRPQNPTASERLRHHLYHIPELFTGNEASRAGDPESVASRAPGQAVEVKRSNPGQREDPLATTRRWDLEE